MKLHRWLLSAALAFPLLARGHGNEEHLRGVLKSKDGSTMVINTSTGESRVEVDANTRFEAAGKPATADDAHTGQRVVVHAAKHHGTLRASRVQLGAMDTDASKGQKP